MSAVSYTKLSCFLRALYSIYLKWLRLLIKNVFNCSSAADASSVNFSTYCACNSLRCVYIWSICTYARLIVSSPSLILSSIRCNSPESRLSVRFSIACTILVSCLSLAISAYLFPIAFITLSAVPLRYACAKALRYSSSKGV